MPDYPKAVISTSLGDMTVELWNDVAPNHVENFLKLGSSGFYNNLTFHRILPGFMVQGGCPKGDGTGDGPRRLQAEFNDTSHVLGTLSMARSSDPNSASCQFFICLGDAAFLDGKYSAFGQIADEAALETLKKLSQVKVHDAGGSEASTPVEPIKIDKMTVSEA